MGTIVTIDVPDRAAAAAGEAARDGCVERAFGWFREVERACSRFDPGSELMQITGRAGEPMRVSPLLFEAVRFAVAVADETDGAFDPTVGLELERLGFNREHRTGRAIATPIGEAAAGTWRDVHLDAPASSITLRRPVVLDLGGVAKGMAVDLAARELEPLRDFGIDAGGDLFLGGHNASGAPWLVGIRHPLHTHDLLDSVRVTGRAVCTSGNYERRGTDGGAGHIIDPGTGVPPVDLLSVTVMAESAMLADALATAAFVLGPDRGRRLLETHGVDGLLFTTGLDRVVTKGSGGDSPFAR